MMPQRNEGAKIRKEKTIKNSFFVHLSVCASLWQKEFVRRS